MKNENLKVTEKMDMMKRIPNENNGMIIISEVKGKEALECIESIENEVGKND